ncbi:MAG TPA: glycosyltransferase family 2 protein [Gammaproteobacteria bacterium]|nr:glycosyltransferase family 2 protein [Gammaproteobacteria bacterium]
MSQYLPVTIIALLFVLVAALGFIDRRKRRPRGTPRPLSFVVPCYNDADTVGETIASIYEVCGQGTDVIVADDGSTDGSRELLERLRVRYGFRLVLNERNIGKSQTLNEQFRLAKHELIVFTDADVIVNERSLQDALSRLEDPSIGAVSCPYAPQNSGLIALMQHVEYNMLSFIQGAYNCFSAIALWGGFIAIKKKAFLDAGCFSLNAITEDMDLAFKLNEAGWRVEQSFVPVRTYVPDTLKKWYKQKVRWSSGGLQCFFNHYRIWLRNPLHVLFVFSYCILLTSAVIKMGKDIVLWNSMLDYLNSMNDSQALGISLHLTGVKYGVHVMRDLVLRLSFTAFSLPFVLPLVSTLKRVHLFLLVVPFSILYVPVFSTISMCGVVYFLRRRKALLTASRAW